MREPNVSGHCPARPAWVDELYGVAPHFAPESVGQAKPSVLLQPSLGLFTYGLF